MVFAVAHFLNMHMRSSLWMQLMANDGGIGPLEQALGLLRADLLALPKQPLLCIDEVDLLRTSDNEPRQAAHIQVLEFLESLRGLASLLLIGQRVAIDTSSLLELKSLEDKEVLRLLSAAGLKVDEDNLQQLVQTTEGNPRLLELSIALIRSGVVINDLPQLAKESSAQPFFHRLWRRLDDKERFMLGILSVLRNGTAPASWPEYGQALTRLLERRLVKRDLAGGVALLPFYRHLVYHDLLAEQRQRLHQQAAVMRAELGEYTRAAYHFWRAEDYEAAVAVWFPFQEAEIRRGQGSAAHEIFRQISPARFKKQSRQKLKVIQARLYLLAGDAESALAGLENFAWHPDQEISADAYKQSGIAAGILGQSENARERYEQAIETLARLVSKITELHFLRAQAFNRDSDIETARRELVLAQHDLDRMHGLIEYMTGDFKPAQKYFRKALAAAESVDDVYRVALSHQFLSMVTGRQGDTKRAEHHAQEAIEHFRHTGNHLKAEGVRAEMAGIYLNTREFEKVIEPGERALRFFEQIKHERWITAISNNLAEAYLELGQMDKAKEYAYRVLRMENQRSLPYAHYTLGLLFEREKKPDQAEAALKQGIFIAQQNEDRFIEAYLQRALAQFYLRRGSEKSQAPLQEASRLFEEMGLAKELAITQKLAATGTTQNS
jgi:tetratricopeptide (TPR) repeat protein